MERLKNRLGVVDADNEVRLVSSIKRETEHLSNGYWKDGSSVSYKLFYLKTTSSFSVLVVNSSLQEGVAIDHSVITAYTPEMYEESVEAITDKQYMRAAASRLSAVAYRKWCTEKYGSYTNLHSERLRVYFKDRGKPFEIKIKSALCEGFAKNESIEQFLEHPGVLSRMHQVLEKFGRRLEDRHYMRFDHMGGPIKMLSKEAKVCPYCGAEPLATDLPA